MTIRTAYAVTEVFAAPKIVSFLFARMTGKTSLGNLFRRLVFERDDFRGIAFFQVGLTWSMTRLAACYFLFPTADFGETGVRSMGKRFELVFVTVFAGVATDVIISRRRRGPGATSRCDAPDHGYRRSAEND